MTNRVEKEYVERYSVNLLEEDKKEKGSES